jgi:hypothetical protein
MHALLPARDQEGVAAFDDGRGHDEMFNQGFRLAWLVLVLKIRVTRVIRGGCS